MAHKVTFSSFCKHKVFHLLIFFTKLVDLKKTKKVSHRYMYAKNICYNLTCGATLVGKLSVENGMALDNEEL